ncbi:hypothetical protein ACROYT_G027291 [Oculina patagonica]
MNITDKKQTRAVLFHLAGPEVQTVFETLSGTGEDYDTALAKLNEYLIRRKAFHSSIQPFERHAFRQAAQGPTEGMDAYVELLVYKALRNPTGQQLNQISTESRGPAHRTRNNIERIRSIQVARAKTQNKLCVSVAVVRRAIAQKILRVLRMARRAVPVASKGILLVSAKVLQKLHKTRLRGSATPQRNGLPCVTTEPEISDDEYLFATGGNKETTTVPVTIGSTSIPVIIDSSASVNVLDSATFNKGTFSVNSQYKMQTADC